MDSLFEELAGYKAVVWDWNGTLFNDVDCCFGVTVSLMKHYGIKPICLDEYLQKFRFPVIEYYEEIGFDFSDNSFEELAAKWISTYKETVAHSSLYPGTIDLLAKLKESGIRSWILTAANENDVSGLVEKNNIKEYIVAVFGLNNHYATSKIHRGHQLIKKIGAHLESAIMVGDTDHDVQVAKELGLDVILLSGGHQHHERWSGLNVKVYHREAWAL